MIFLGKKPLNFINAKKDYEKIVIIFIDEFRIDYSWYIE